MMQQITVKAEDTARSEIIFSTLWAKLANMMPITRKIADITLHPVSHFIARMPTTASIQRSTPSWMERLIRANAWGVTSATAAMSKPLRPKKYSQQALESTSSTSVLFVATHISLDSFNLKYLRVQSIYVAWTGAIPVFG
jgi:hypothetical protein